LEWISCGWFADFGWIFLQLGLNAHGFLDEVSNFLQFYCYVVDVYGEIAILLQEVLFIETLREEHKCFFLSQSFTCPKFVNCPC
jgi:hypothetical protein